jgi:hypothetical protein
MIAGVAVTLTKLSKLISEKHPSVTVIISGPRLSFKVTLVRISRVLADQDYLYDFVLVRKHSSVNFLSHAVEYDYA